MDIKDLEQIVKILKENGVTEFELEQENTHIKLSRGQLQPTHALLPQSVDAPAYLPQPMLPHTAPATGAPAVPQAVDEYAGYHKVESPIVGTFYRRPSPDAEPFVREGDVVKKGMTLCIIEAMKLMNEIEAPISGRVTRVLPEDSQVVEFGELLILIDPNG
ncbi:MAG: acetyl-CoA carboxylase biotin carboxyl carrier protein [Bdellovibrionales bacterium]|nr:acetyl-CoA carboxylase biotin carboxyl carrier protein [Bdellovibrionales bacterium]